MCLSIFVAVFNRHTYNPGEKFLGTVLQFLIFSVISRFPLKTVHPFRNFLAVLPSPTLYKVETRKKDSGYTRPTLFVR